MKEHELNHPEAEFTSHTQPLAEQLQALAQTVEADPAFVTQLEQRLQNAMRASIVPPAPVLPKWQTVTQTITQAIGQFLMPRRMVWGFTSILLVLSLLIMLITPPARATMRNVFAALGLIEQRQVDQQTIQVAEVVSEERSVTMNLSQLTQAAPFRLRLPTWLPAALTLTGGSINQTGATTEVSVVYHPAQAERSNGHVAIGTTALLVLITQGEPATRPLLEINQSEVVLLDLATGETSEGRYAHGSWRGTPNAQGEVEGVHWDATADDAWLTWQVGTLTYLLQADGLQMQKEQMIQIAESFKEIAP